MPFIIHLPNSSFDRAFPADETSSTDGSSPPLIAQDWEQRVRRLVERLGSRCEASDGRYSSSCERFSGLGVLCGLARRLPDVRCFEVR